MRDRCGTLERTSERSPCPTDPGAGVGFGDALAGGDLVVLEPVDHSLHEGVTVRRRAGWSSRW